MAIEALLRLTDGPGDRKAGSIISVKAYPNNGWGAGESLPNYAVVRILNISYSQFEQYNKRHEKFIDTDRLVWKRRAKYRVDFNLVPTAIREALFNNGFCEISDLKDVGNCFVVNDFVNTGTLELEE